MKNVVVQFSAPGFNSKHYDKVWEDLKAAGQSHPKGLISHVGFAKPDGTWNVIDVWESIEDFQAFGKTLMPIIQNSGVNMPEPGIYPAHFVYHNEQVPA